MKKLLSFAFVASMCLSLFATDIFNYIPLNGNVKSYTRTDYTITSKFGNYYRTPSVKFLKTFDSFGKEIESTELSPKDSVINKISSTYDLSGNLTEQNCFNSENELIWKNIITYKNNLKVDSSEYDSNGTLKAKIIFTYENDKLIDETGYNGDGALIWKTIFTYNENGLLSTESQYIADGSLDTKLVYSYTENNKIDSIISYDSYEKDSNQKIFRYSADGLLNEITTYTSQKEVSNRLVLKYDSSNNVVRISDYKISQKFGTTVNELISQSEFSYNDILNADAK